MDKGFVLVDKPKGWTSHDVVASVRKLAEVKKVGHAGTLDPMATGLLVVGLGRATRLLRFVQGLTKRYSARAVLGVATDTLDADGAVISRESLPVSERDVVTAMKRFTGSIMQIPPMVSARKVEGKRLYELAREGKTVEREARKAEIYDLALTDFAPSDYSEVGFEVTCGTGTYVRTLADDIAGVLGGRAHLVELRRLSNGSLHVDDSHTLEELKAGASDGSFKDLITTPAAALVDLASVVVDADVEQGVRHGVAFPLRVLDPQAPDDGPFSVLTRGGERLPSTVLTANRQ